VRDIYDFPKLFKRAAQNVRECGHISSDNKDLIFEFIEYKQAQGTGLARCLKYLNILKNFSLSVYDKDNVERERRSKKSPMMKCFSGLTKGDLQHEMAELENSNLSDSTKRDYKVFVRLFIGWVLHEKSGSQEPYDPKEHGYPAIFKGIKIKEPGETVKASDLLAGEEKQRILGAAKNLRDKALVGCLDESGMRPGELLSLKVGNVTIEEQFGELSLEGKTGIRSAFIIRNLAYLVQWLDSYDCRNDPSAPLWPNFEKSGQPLSYAGLRQMLKRLAAKAKVKKRVYPYIFRHTAATSDAVELTEPLMRKVYGWGAKSSTPSRYEHLTGKDTKLAKLRQAGITIEQGKERIRLCPRCKVPNPVNATMCHKCGSVLSLKIAVEQRDRLAVDVEKIKEDLNNLRREMFRREHNLAITTTNEEIDRAMKEEEEYLQILREKGYVVQIDKSGNFVKAKLNLQEVEEDQFFGG